MKLLAWSKKVFALLLHSPGSSPVSGTKACSAQCTWVSLPLPMLQNLPPSPRAGQATLFGSPLAREGSILLDALAALICVFSSVNCECGWPEQCWRWGLTRALEEDSNLTKRTGEKKYSQLVNMEKLKLNHKLLSLCPQIQLIATKMCIYPILLYHIYQNVTFAALFIVWHLKTLLILPSFLFSDLIPAIILDHSQGWMERINSFTIPEFLCLEIIPVLMWWWGCSHVCKMPVWVYWTHLTQNSLSY